MFNLIFSHTASFTPFAVNHAARRRVNWTSQREREREREKKEKEARCQKREKAKTQTFLLQNIIRTRPQLPRNWWYNSPFSNREKQNWQVHNILFNFFLSVFMPIYCKMQNKSKVLRKRIARIAQGCNREKRRKKKERNAMWNITLISLFFLKKKKRKVSLTLNRRSRKKGRINLSLCRM